jgi:predicted helicase
MVRDQLGIVYTPIEAVDFIIHSVNELLKQEFGRSLSDENIHILDPFTGTGTFITRLLQSGLIQSRS